MKHRIIGLFAVFVPLALLGALVPTHPAAQPVLMNAAQAAPVSPALPQATKAAQATVPTPAAPATPAHKPTAG